MGDENKSLAFAGLVVGALLMAVSLPLTFVTFHYAPPGGSGVVDGHKIPAFTETISTWKFAQVATWSHILPYFLLVAGRVAAYSADSEPAETIADILHAIVQVTFLVGCVLFVGLAVEFGHTVMPANGQQGLLPALHGSPYRVTTGDIPATPFFTSSLGIGWWLMAAAIAIGVLSIWDKLLMALGGLLCLLAVFGIVDLIFHTGIDSFILRWVDRL